MARPPELISLATSGIKEQEHRIVLYPDPPLDQEELRLLRTVRTHLRSRTMTQWLAEVPT